ncbi:MAG: DUF1800 domain-containing protein [Bryobacteraceae bacterium]
MPRNFLKVCLLVVTFVAGLEAQVVITNKPDGVRAQHYYTFTASLNGANVTSGITWAVNGVTSGNATVGTFSGFRFNSPAFAPATGPVTISAVSTANPLLGDSFTLTILNPVPTLASVSPATLSAGNTTLTINGYGFVAGAVVTMNGTPVPTTYVSATRLAAVASIETTPTKDTVFAVINPDPGSISSDPFAVPPPPPTNVSAVSDSAAVRFLEQAAFGADYYSFWRVKNLGFSKWIDEQIDEPRSKYPDLNQIPLAMTPVQARFFRNAVHGRDQLRQRIALALHEIWVVSSLEENLPDQMIPYLNIFNDYAFDNYRNMMRKVTLNPAMGDYLDMRNSVKANPAAGTLANENYAREILQLFTTGLYQLNPDGTMKLDASSNPIPTYTQKTISELARVMTGWTYPTKPGATPRGTNPAYYVGDMVYWEPNHDEGAKTLLDGVVDASGKNADADLTFALDNIFNHPNVGPFVATKLIKQLVTSNPSPEYVARVAAAFNDNGLGVRGDMKAVIKAILLDFEARLGDSSFGAGLTDVSSFGALKEPVLFLIQTLRGLGAQVNDSNTLASRGSALGQNIFFPPTVFSYYSPLYDIPGTTLLGPEFQINTRSTAIERVNQINTLIYGNYGTGATVDYGIWTYLASTPSTFADTIGFIFLHGDMPSDYRKQVVSAITGTTGSNLEKARAGLYVTLTSGYYSVKK